jgi:hypothetical protein
MSPRERPPSWFTALFVVCWWAGLLTLAFAITGGPWWLTVAVAMLALSGALFGAAAASLRRRRGGR